MKNSEILIQQIKSKPESIEFQNVINHINNTYHYTPTPFRNGPDYDCVISKAGENEGSCKIFTFAKLKNLDETQTLNCFGQYYRDDVLKSPDSTDHANIRTFMKYGWAHVIFDRVALEPVSL